MSEVENQNSLNVQEAPAETAAHVEPEQQVSVPKVSQEEKQEYKWNEMRRQKRELEETIKMQQQLLEEMRNIQKPQVSQVDEMDAIGDEEYIPKGKVKKLAVKEAQKIAQQEVERILAERERGNFKERLQSKYGDFDDVVNADTLALLEEKKPELAKTLATTKDPYIFGVQSYEYIKAFGLADEVPGARRAKEVERKLEENKKTVQSPQAYDKRPMAQAFKMTEAEKSKLYEEMMACASQAGFSY